MSPPRLLGADVGGTPGGETGGQGDGGFVPEGSGSPQPKPKQRRRQRGEGAEGEGQVEGADMADGRPRKRWRAADVATGSAAAGDDGGNGGEGEAVAVVADGAAAALAAASAAAGAYGGIGGWENAAAVGGASGEGEAVAVAACALADGVAVAVAGALPAVQQRPRRESPQSRYHPNDWELGDTGVGSSDEEDEGKQVVGHRGRANVDGSRGEATDALFGSYFEEDARGARGSRESGGRGTRGRGSSSPPMDCTSSPDMPHTSGSQHGRNRTRGLDRVGASGGPLRGGSRGAEDGEGASPAPDWSKVVGYQPEVSGSPMSFGSGGRMGASSVSGEDGDDSEHGSDGKGSKPRWGGRGPRSRSPQEQRTPTSGAPAAWGGLAGFLSSVGEGLGGAGGGRGVGAVEDDKEGGTCSPREHMAQVGAEGVRSVVTRPMATGATLGKGAGGDMAADQEAVHIRSGKVLEELQGGLRVEHQKYAKEKPVEHELVLLMAPHDWDTGECTVIARQQTILGNAAAAAPAGGDAGQQQAAAAVQTVQMLRHPGALPPLGTLVGTGSRGNVTKEWKVDQDHPLACLGRRDLYRRCHDGNSTAAVTAAEAVGHPALAAGGNGKGNAAGPSAQHSAKLGAGVKVAGTAAKVIGGGEEPAAGGVGAAPERVTFTKLEPIKGLSAFSSSRMWGNNVVSGSGG